MPRVKAENLDYYREHKKHPFLNLARNNLKALGCLAVGAFCTGVPIITEMNSTTPAQFPANTGEATIFLTGIGFFLGGVGFAIVSIPEFISDLNDNRYLRRNLS